MSDEDAFQSWGKDDADAPKCWQCGDPYSKDELVNGYCGNCGAELDEHAHDTELGGKV